VIAAAPGKLFTTGAYAILEGAPAIVCAVNRYVLADTSGPATTRPEVVELARACGGAAPAIDASSLEVAGRKLGLGSSAAGAVAAAAVLLGEKNLRDQSARRRIFDEARRAHSVVQPRGSGADVAAATFGGVVRVQRMGEELAVDSVEWPHKLVLRAFALDRSARTSDALDRLAERRAAAGSALERIVAAAHAGASTFAAGDVEGFVRAASDHVDGLAALGRALDLPLVPDEVRRARELLFSAPKTQNSENPVLLPSGAGGGDTVLWLGARAPTDHEAATLEGLGLSLLDLDLDTLGVHHVYAAASAADRN
jgi:phosphomevalonate kinase